ncbi:hypothetical protein FKM82_018509 [Ascaphus truei]
MAKILPPTPFITSPLPRSCFSQKHQSNKICVIICFGILKPNAILSFKVLIVSLVFRGKRQQLCRLIYSASKPLKAILSIHVQS